MSLVPVEYVMGLPMIIGAHTSDEVQTALNWASSAVESYCEREFAYTQQDVVNIDPHYGNGGKAQARLPHPPVWNVAQVMAEMRVGQGLSWINLTYYQWTQGGLLYDTSQYYGYNGVTGQDFWSGGPTGEWAGPPSWPFLPGSLQVIYDHGFVLPGADPVEGVQNLPQDVIDAVIRAAAYYLLNPGGPGVAALDVGDVKTTFTQIAAVSDSPGGPLDVTLLGKYRLVHL